MEELVAEVLLDAVDLDLLGESADAVVTGTVAGVDIEIPADPTDALVLGGEDESISIELPFADDADDAVVTDEAVSYDNNNGSSTVPVVKADGALQILTTIDNADAPTRYEYALELPDGAVPELDDSTAFPVVADPKYSLSWATWYPRFTLTYSRSETRLAARVYMVSGLAQTGGCTRIPNKLGAWGCQVVMGSYWTYVTAAAIAADASNKCLEVRYGVVPSTAHVVRDFRVRSVTC